MVITKIKDIEELIIIALLRSFNTFAAYTIQTIHPNRDDIYVANETPGDFYHKKGVFDAFLENMRQISLKKRIYCVTVTVTVVYT
jgi:hypothetical protein